MASAIYFAVTTANYHNTRVHAIMETWGKDVSDRIFFFSDARAFEEQVVHLPVPSDYGSASLKLVAGLQWVRDSIKLDYDWYVICDDDTFVFTDKLEKFLDGKDPTKSICYGLSINHYPQLPDLYYPSGGAGFVLGRAAFQALLDRIDECELFLYTDVTIGACMKEAGIAMENIDGFYSQAPERVTAGIDPAQSEELIKSAYTFHYITPQAMHQLYNLK